MGEIEVAAKRAKLLLDKIPLEDKSLLAVVTEIINDDPTMHYEYSHSGEYYQVISERGCTRRVLVAKNEDEMVDHFVHEAIWSYALRYELKHRRHFENNMRQTHEVMEWCYSFISGKKIVEEYYNDEIHIILDLIDSYKKICRELLRHKNQPQDVIDLCNYIINNEYADNPYGGMLDPKSGLKKVHNAMEKIQKHLSDKIDILLPFEQYYKKVI